MPRYLCTDITCPDEIEIEANTAEEAATAFADGYELEDTGSTGWLDVYVQEIDADGEPLGDRETVTITLDPREPDCDHPDGHAYASPHWLLGGLRENPGVWGHGGGATITVVCLRCGLAKTTDTWAQRPDTGEQGLTSVSYSDERAGEYRAEIRRQLARYLRLGSGYTLIGDVEGPTDGEYRATLEVEGTPHESAAEAADATCPGRWTVELDEYTPDDPARVAVVIRVSS